MTNAVFAARTHDASLAPTLMLLLVFLALLIPFVWFLWRYRALLKPGPKRLFSHGEPREIAAAVTDNEVDRRRTVLELLLMDDTVGLSQYRAARELRASYRAHKITPHQYYAELRGISELATASRRQGNHGGN